MAVRKKGSRRIVVDDVAYLWRFPRRPTRYQEDGFPEVIVTVSRENCRQAVLVLFFPNRYHPNGPIDAPVRPVLPSDVAKGIRDARAAGWKDDEPSPQFGLLVREDALEVSA